MKRYFKTINKSVETIKNFHDEQEWRYIPDPKILTNINNNNDYNIDSIIANPNLINHSFELTERFIDQQSSFLEDERNRESWLDFSYSDIRYLIVPDNQARLETIEYIMKLEKELFDPKNNLKEKYILISKILVLDEIRKDW